MPTFDRLSRKAYDMQFIEERTFSVLTFTDIKGQSYLEKPFCRKAEMYRVC